MTAKQLFPDAIITGELLEHLRLPEDLRYELVEGRIEPIVSPTNQDHALAMTRISTLLVTLMPGWTVMSGDPGVYVRRKPDTVRGPDVVAISSARYAERDPASAFLTVVPELVIEIVSPSNADEDTARKVREYVEAGAEWVWVVRLDTATVTTTDRYGWTSERKGNELLTLPNGATIHARRVFLTQQPKQPTRNRTTGGT